MQANRYAWHNAGVGRRSCVSATSDRYRFSQLPTGWGIKPRLGQASRCEWANKSLGKFGHPCSDARNAVSWRLKEEKGGGVMLAVGIGPIGPFEGLIILAVVILIFGVGKLSDVGAAGL